MAVPEHARIIGKTVQYVEIETERRQNEDDTQDVREIDQAMEIYFTDGSSLRLGIGGENEWQHLFYDFTPARRRAAAVPKRPAAKKKKR